MPILDVRVVATDGDVDAAWASRCADALGRVFGAAPGTIWVRVEPMPATRYAENDTPLDTASLPVFVTLTRAHWPSLDERRAEAAAVCRTVAAVLGRPVERVHLEYAPPGAGRVAFGGRLLEAAGSDVESESSKGSNT